MLNFLTRDMTTAMVSRPSADRQILDLQNGEWATAWIVFCGEIRAAKKEDKISNDGSIVDLQVTNLFLSMCVQDAIIKLRSPRNLIDTPYKDIRSSIQNCFS